MLSGVVARRRARREIWRDAWYLIYEVGNVLEVLLGHPSEADFTRASALAAALESRRTPTSSRLIDAIRTVVRDFSQHLDVQRMNADYDELEAALAEFRKATGAVPRSRRRIAAILGGAAFAGVLAGTLSAIVARVAIAPETLSGLVATPFPQAAVIRFLYIGVTTAVMAWTINYVRPRYGWWIGTFLAVLAADLPILFSAPIFAIAANADDYLYSTFNLDVSQAVLRLPFYVLLTWAGAVGFVLGFDYLNHRHRARRTA